MYRATPQRKQKKSRRPLLWVGIFLIAALVVGGGYYFARHYHKNSGPTAAEKAAEKKQNQQTKQDTAKRVESSTSDTTATSSDSTSTKPNTTGDAASSSSSNSSTSATISANIDRANQLQSGADLSVRATVVGTTSGSCQITLSKSGQSSFTKTFPITVGATSATCGNADIPISSFSVSGTWQVQLIIISGSSQSAAVTAQASVQK